MSKATFDKHNYKEYRLTKRVNLFKGYKRWTIHFLGYALFFKNIKEWGLLFSQRNGYAENTITIGDWFFSFFKLKQLDYEL